MRRMMGQLIVAMVILALGVGCMGTPKVGGGGDFVVNVQPFGYPVIVMSSPDAMTARETPSQLQHNNSNSTSQPLTVGKETLVGRGSAQEGAIAPAGGRDTTSADAAASGTASTEADASGGGISGSVTPIP